MRTIVDTIYANGGSASYYDLRDAVQEQYPHVSNTNFASTISKGCAKRFIKRAAVNDEMYLSIGDKLHESYRQKVDEDYVNGTHSPIEDLTCKVETFINSLIILASSKQAFDLFKVQYPIMAGYKFSFDVRLAQLSSVFRIGKTKSPLLDSNSHDCRQSKFVYGPVAMADVISGMYEEV